MSSVSLQSVTKLYGKFVAAHDINVEIPEGEFVVLLGPSGCGKTTTLRMIAGFVDPTEGRILLGGRDVTALPPRRRDIGMVFQNYALFPNMSVSENVAYGLKRRGIGGGEAARRVAELLEMVQLTSHAEHSPDELSGGQQQRVALARALAHTPKVLLMDEPLGALDMKLREQLQDEILQIQKELKITTILVTHDQHEAMSMADRILLMEDGVIRQEGTADEIYLEPESEFVASFIGKRNLLEAEFLGSKPCGAGRARLTGGEEIELLPRRPVASGERLRLTLRPEVLRLYNRSCSAGRALLPARVEQRRFLGNVVHYRLRLDSGQTLLAETRVREFEPGAEVGVGWDPSDLVAFPDDGRH